METVRGRDEQIHSVTVPCPVCSKTYSVDSLELSRRIQTGQSAAFECVACKTRFGATISRKQELAASDFETGVGDSTRIETFIVPFVTPRVRPSTGRPLSSEPSLLRDPAVVRDSNTVARPAPLKRPQTACPKCRAMNPRGALDCRSCGIVFAKYKPEDERARTLDDLQLAGRPEFIDLWKRVIEDYENLQLHEDFLEACRASGSLAFAAHMYGRVIELAPSEVIARRMRRRIVGLAALHFARGAAGRWRFRVPGFVDLAIVMGSAVTTADLMLGNMHSLTGIGAAMLTLALGVRFFLRPLN